MDQFDAAREGALERVQQLTTKQNVDAVGDEGLTLLHIACRGGHDHVATFLVSLGANLDARENDGWTPLHYAAYNAHPHCVKLLLGAGADAAIAADFDGSIPLHFSLYSAENAALFIAAHPAGVNAVDNFGRTPLHRAAKEGNANVVRVLLDGRSVVNVVENDGCTPLSLALGLADRSVAELLLDRGAQLNRVKLEAIPEWAVSFVARRNSCRSSCWAMLELARRCSRVIGGNGRDVLGILARMVWDSRRDTLW